MKPPFSYYGGKQRIISQIIPHIPKHTVYAEPFCGGATLLFAKPDYRTGNNDNYRESINDINSDIINFFKVLRDEREKLEHWIESIPYSQEEYKEAKKYKGNDRFLKAYYYYINIQQSYANKLRAGWAYSVYKTNHAVTYRNKINNLKMCSDRLKSVYLCNEDALLFIDRWDSPQTFFYCDPPYPGANQGHYSGYTQEDFENLIESLKNCKGSFILSCYDNKAVPKNWKKYEINTRTTASNTKNGGHREIRTECIWIRQATEQPSDEILKIYQKQEQLKLF